MPQQNLPTAVFNGFNGVYLFIFSLRRRSAWILKFCMRSKVTTILGLHKKKCEMHDRGELHFADQCAKQILLGLMGGDTTDKSQLLPELAMANQGQLRSTITKYNGVNWGPSRSIGTN